MKARASAVAHVRRRWKTLVEACASARSQDALLHPANLPPEFCDLSSGIAGEYLQKWRNYRVRVAVLCPPGCVLQLASPDGRRGIAQGLLPISRRASRRRWLEEIGDDALDQRGHGETNHGGAHSIQAYIGDVDALLDAAGIGGPIVLLGHSFGGMVANLYAAARPARVRGVILEDIDVARDDHHDFMLAWSGVYPSREALEEKVGARLAPYLRRSMREAPGGWTLTFDPQEVLDSKAALNGDHWAEWLSHHCPALVIGGATSRVVSGETLAEMARRRPDTQLVTIDAGHCVHVDKPVEFVEAVRQFLATLG